MSDPIGIWVTLKPLMALMLIVGFVLYFSYLKNDVKKSSIIAFNIIVSAFCLFAIWLSASQLHQWYLTGSLLNFSRFHHPHMFYISYDQFPFSFIKMAVFYVFSLLVFGIGGVLAVIRIIQRKFKSYPSGE
jgi:hypothetical protein